VTEKPLISIIDDDPFMRDSIRQLIKSFGYTVATFSSALAFLESPDLKQTSCLIADVQMPGMTGESFTDVWFTMDAGSQQYSSLHTRMIGSERAS
jgi:FixJ family two-component response regulator